MSRTCEKQMNNSAVQSPHADVVVVGAGHAGVEAALAVARMGKRAILVTLDPTAIARMSCNPAIGGLGKGHLVREIDALGGEMGLAADATAIQFRRLNKRKGAAVRGTRVQSDRDRYSYYMAARVNAQERLQLVSQEVRALKISANRVEGVVLGDGSAIRCHAIIVTSGTFLRGALFVGDDRQAGGRLGEGAAAELSQALSALGISLARLKTGTPCRIDRDSIDFTSMEKQPGDDPPPRLSAWSHWPDGKPPLRQIPCHITYTNQRTHEIVRTNVEKSAMYSGAISGTGPRYCPAIEDKIVRFPDRDRHQIFVEPQGLDCSLIYPNGISTSLPADIQHAFVRTIRGFENARIVDLGYAVEYDFSDPRQLDASLAVRGVNGLYFAGQINGTTGYEEAAAQGLIAGVNSVRMLDNVEPLVLRRDQAYIGVMIDDLINCGTQEPYRMFTSRAEYRLLLREDNATTRLTPLGHNLGLISDARYDLFQRKNGAAHALQSYLESSRPRPTVALNHALADLGTTPVRPGTSLAELLLRPQVSLGVYVEQGLVPDHLMLDDELRDRVEIAIKYAGYIEKQREQAARLAKLDHQALPPDMDYAVVNGLSNEVREKLLHTRPRSLGQASRIPGMTPAAIALLSVYLRRRRAA